MEDDRSNTNLGPDIHEVRDEPKAVIAPKRRFIGRRAAAEAVKNRDTDGEVTVSIDNAALQGNSYEITFHCDHLVSRQS